MIAAVEGRLPRSGHALKKCKNSLKFLLKVIRFTIQRQVEDYQITAKLTVGGNHD
jgi:hypothetical protein